MNKHLLKGAMTVVVAMMIATSVVAPMTTWARTSVIAAAAQSQETDKGVLIARVQKDGPAAKAGLRRGDILISMDGKAVNTVTELMTAANALKPNTSAKLVVLRGDAEQTLTVTVGDRSGVGFLGLTPAGDDVFQQLPMPRLEMLLGPTVIEDVVKAGPADKAGLKKGDVIMSVDGAVLSPTMVLADVIGKKKPGDSVTLQVQTGGDTAAKREVKVTLGENPDKKGVAWLGVQYRPGFGFTERGGRGVPVPLPGNMTAGAVVGVVLANSPAAKAGLAVRDVITEVDGKQVTDPKILVDAVQAKKIGDTLTLKILRGTETKEIKVTLGENPNDKGKPFMGVQLGGVFERRIVPHAEGNGIVPESLKTIEGKLEGIIDQVPNADWAKVAAEVSSIEKAWASYQAESTKVSDGVAETLKRLTSALRAKDGQGTMQAANDLSASIVDLFDFYHPVVPTDIGRLDVYERQIILDVARQDFAAASGTLAKMNAVWVRVRSSVLAHNGKNVAEQFDKSLAQQADALNLKDNVKLTDEAKTGLEVVDALEKVY